MALSNTETIVLGVLARRPASGYDLRAWMDEHGVYLGYRATLSPIYRTLAKLQQRGFVEFVVEDRRNGPDAKVYELTDDGRAAVLAWARSPFVPSPRPMDPDFTIRFVLGGQFGRDIALDIVGTELKYRVKQRAAERYRADPAIAPIPELDADWCHTVQQLSHERGYASTSAYIAWLELTLQRLTDQPTEQEAL